MEEEISQLKDQLEKQRIRCETLEEQLDDLAIDNDRLRKLLAAGGSSNVASFTNSNVASHRTNVGGGVLGNFTPVSDNSQNETFECRDLLIEGDDNCPDAVLVKVQNACGGMNALCAAFCIYPGLGTKNPETIEAFVCGGVDKTLRVYAPPSGTGWGLTPPLLLRSYSFSAPILCVDCDGPYIACSLMDGSHAVIDISRPESVSVPVPVSEPSASSSSSSSSNVLVFKDHTKYVVGIKWSPDGAFLATVSHDKTVNLYKKSVAATGEFSMVRVHTARFMVTPECAVFARCSRPKADKESEACIDQSEGVDGSSVGDVEGTEGKESKTVNSAIEGQGEVEGEGEVEWELIIGLRDTSHLTYLHCSTYDQRFISLNELTWDTHSSFTPLQLVVSPNSKYLLVATDKNFHFMVKVGCNKRLRFFAGGHSSGDYGKPKVSFDHTGKYIYCNNEDGSSVTVYSISAEKPVRTLSEHDGSVRDVVCHPSCSLLLTASYDKSVILWQPAVK